MSEDNDSKENYEQAKRQREEYVENILRSKANKKIIVAGTGTGKTFLFKKAVREKR